MGKGVRRCARFVVPALMALAVAVPVHQANAATAPRNTALPVVSGTPSVGLTVTTTTGTWSGSPAPTYTFQWQRCVVGGTCSNISAATKTTYVITSTDAGKQLRSKVTAKNSAGSKIAYSGRTTAVTAPAAPANTALPTISGTPKDGSTLTS